MICYKDKTFCASEVPVHTCGREISKEELKHAEHIGLPIAYAYFCNGKSIEEQLKEVELERAEEDGKMYGKCESCGMETVLVEEVGLCGPCCFGEADTINGDW